VRDEDGCGIARAVLLTVTTTHRAAADLAFVLRRHPEQRPAFVLVSTTSPARGRSRRYRRYQQLNLDVAGCTSPHGAMMAVR
jgi:hypothetical protein